jgi:IS4 transposase
MSFAQLTHRESLRDIESCLRGHGSKLYHLGIRSKISRSTLARANDTRDWRIFQDFALTLITQARKLYTAEKFSVEIENTVYALDSTIIDLCLSVFPWAEFRTTKAGVKLHTLLDLRSNIPSIILISCANLHDVNILDQLVFDAGAIYIMDRGYLDFSRLYNITQDLAFFVTRSKSNTLFRRLYSNEVDPTTGVIADQTIKLASLKSSAGYPDKLRRIVYCDPVTKKKLVFLTNNFKLSAKTIAELYKARWQIELFFKWIKQHLKIKSFFGTSENAVRSQIWIAVSTYLIVAIIKKQLNIKKSLYSILQTLSVAPFDKTPVLQALSDVNYTNSRKLVFGEDKLLNLNIF